MQREFTDANVRSPVSNSTATNTHNVGRTGTSQVRVRIGTHQRIGFLNFQHETAIWIRNVERAMSLAKGAIAGTRIIFLGWNGRGKAKGDPPAMTTALQRL